jgi:membrane protease YdiL (CAAX protease family)
VRRTPIGVAAPPIVEEIVFRGLLSPLVDPLDSMVLFTCIHRGLWLRGAALLFALAMETLMATSGTLLVCIAAHLAVNLTTYVFVQRIPLVNLSDGSSAIAL